MSVHVHAPQSVRAKLLAGSIADGFSALALFHYFAQPAELRSAGLPRA
jgi:hypothetical protein